MTIDTTATEPPRNWFLDIAREPTEILLAEAIDMRARLALAQQGGHRSDARAYELRLADIERAIAVHNRRATEALDQQQDCVTQHEIDALLALLRIRDLPEAYSVVTDLWAAVQQRKAVQSALTADEVRAVVREAVSERLAETPLAILHATIFRDMVEDIAAYVAEELAGRAPDPAQREADLREAYIQGGLFFAARCSVTDCGAGPSVAAPDAIVLEDAAAEYARSKAGG